LLVTPPLAAGRDFHYTLTAQLMRDGRAVNVTRDVTVRAGEETRVEIQPPSVTASR
jgi:uncharacterized protein (TIGR03000 family)